MSSARNALALSCDLFSMQLLNTEWAYFTDRVAFHFLPWLLLVRSVSRKLDAVGLVSLSSFDACTTPALI